MPTKNETQLEYFMDVVLRNYCRTAEENDILVQEMEDLEACMASLFRENATLRFRLQQAGIEIPASDFLPTEETAEEL